MNDPEMPKIKKKIVNDENKVPIKNYAANNKQYKPYTFDMQRILNERKADDEILKKSAELDEQLKVVDDLFQNSVKQLFICDENKNLPEPPKQGYIIFDHSKYNTAFKNNSDPYEKLSNSQKILIKMSTNKNEHTVNVCYKHLMKRNWSPVLDDIKNVLCNWGANLDTSANKPLLKCEIKNYKQIGQHNFELVMKFISHQVLKTDNGFTNNDLLTLANIAVTISFDHHYKQMINVMKQLFSDCIGKALHEKDDTAIISFCDDLYSKYTEAQMLKIIKFLPDHDHDNTMKTIYKYITFKLFNSLLGITKNKNVFPSTKDWFVQDLVTIDYFQQKPKVILHHVIKLLDHVVVALNLYNDEEKVNCMYNFLYTVIRPSGILESMNLINIIDKWKMHLFKLHIARMQLML